VFLATLHAVLSKWFHRTVITRDIDGKRSDYIFRWHLFKAKSGAAVFLHRIVESDPGPEIHNHPWDLAISLILAGGYWEERMVGRVVTPIDGPGSPVTKMRWMGPGSLNVIRAPDFHRLVIPKGKEAWTLFFHRGERVQKWGFLYPFGNFEMASEEAAVDGVLDPKAGGED